MKEYLNKLPEEIFALLCLARDIAYYNSMPVYLVGGFVRDLILGVENLDLDIVVEGDGIKFAEDFSAKLKAKLIRHRRFGTATIILKPRLKIDIATARSEFYPEPAHLPVVNSGTLQDDLYRRDFTINAMAISIDKKNFGKLIDFFGGNGDLAAKKIRVLHALSFIDDPTRILRAIRFEQRYNFSIESKTMKYLRKAIKLKMLEKVEPQRIRDDLILILKEDHPSREIKRLWELAGFSFINRCLSMSKKSYGLLASIEKQINWFARTCSRHRQLDVWLIYFMGLLDSLNINVIKDICRKLALRKGEEKKILTYKRISSKLIPELDKDKIKPSKLFALFEPLSYEVIILFKAKYKSRNIQKHTEDFFRNYNGMSIYVSGDDLGRLGVAPGPCYQKIFKKVLNAKLNGLVKTKEEELTLVEKLIKSK
jgi:tRNA nucleotidyltransferase (CCA-adding enzyme)